MPWPGPGRSRSRRSPWSWWSSRSVEIEDLLDAVRRVGAGINILRPGEQSRWLAAAARTRSRDWEAIVVGRSLSPRETEVLGLLADGGTNRSIAAELEISAETVQTHIRNILAKLDVSSRLEAVAKAIRLGIVDPPS